MAVKEYFSEKATTAILGVSRQRICYWRKIGLLPPREKGAPQGYSYSDLLAMKVVKSIIDAGIRPGRLKLALDTIKAHSKGVENPLLEKSLFAKGKELFYFQDEKVVDALTGQYQLYQHQDFIDELQVDILRHRESRVSTEASAISLPSKAVV